MSEILHVLTRLAAPVLVHTCEEVWGHIPGAGKHESVHLAHMPKVFKEYVDKGLIERYDRLLKVREEVLRKLEALRVAKTIGSSLEAGVRVYSDSRELFEFLDSFKGSRGGTLETLFIVSEVALVEGIPEGIVRAADVEDLAVEAYRIEHQKCERCWNYRSSVGADKKHPTICETCAEVVEQILSGGQGD
jgi:isoleucyl-tRNA synthetase